MSARLVTQFSEDQTKVLVIGPDSWVQKQVVQQFKQYDFAVVQISFAELTTALILSENWYKIVIVAGFEPSFMLDPRESKQQLALLLSRLSAFSSVKSVRPHVGNSVVLISPDWTAYLDTNETQKQLVMLLRDFQNDVFIKHETVFQIFVQNVLVTQHLSQAGIAAFPPLSFILQSRRNDTIVHIQKQIPILSQKNCVIFLRELLRKPLSGKTRWALISGTAFDSADIAKEIVRRVYVQFGIQMRTISGVYLDSRNDLIAISRESLQEDIENKLKSVRETGESLPALLSPLFDSLFTTKQAWLSQDLQQEKKKTEKKIAKTPEQPPVVKREVHSSPPQSSVTQAQTLPTVPAPSPIKEPTQTKTVVAVKNVSSVSSEKTPKTEPKEAINIDDKLNSLFTVERVVKKADHLNELHTGTTQATKKNKKRTAAFYLGFTVSTFAGFVLLLASIFAFSTHLLKQQVLAHVSQDQESDILAQQIPDLTQFLYIAVQSQLRVYSSFLPSAFFYDSSRVVNTVATFQDISKEVSTLREHQKSQVLGWLGNQVGSGDLSPVNTQGLYENVSRFSALLEELMQTEIAGEKREQLQAVIKSIQRQRASIITYQQFEPLFPVVFGQEGRRTYAIVFQNEQELRATGGFIQAIGLVTFDNGILIDSQVFSSYQLDNQLAAIVEPPSDLQATLGEDRFYLRDANWDPDFPTTASQISWFLKQTLNKKIDGVVSFNIDSFANILESVGPLELPQYNEVITDRNIAERMEFHSEVTLVETSESNDYAVVLLRALLQKISTVSPDSVGDLLASLQKSVDEKQTFVHLNDPAESAITAGLGWNGALINPQCPTQLSVAPCLVDTLAVIDSNVGVNKANYYIKRQDRHTVILNESSALHNHSIVLQNTAQSNSWPKGPYQSYLRVYVPVMSTDHTITVNGEKIGSEELTENLTDQYRIIGFTTTTPIKSESTITLEYTTPLIPEQIDSTELSYVLYVQKQAGVGQPLSAVSISYPPSFTPTVIAPQAQVDLDSITYTNLGSEHVFVGGTYQRN